MLCANTKVSTTIKTERTPDSVNTYPSDRRLPADWPAKSGNFMRTHTTSSTASPLMMPKHSRQPSKLPSRVPAGTPNDKASGVPTMATAMARPFW